MANSDYSRLLAKMAELKTLTGQYNNLITKHGPALSPDSNSTTLNSTSFNKNNMSSTPTPLVTRPGEDHAQYWKYIGKIVPSNNTNDSTALTENSNACWNKAAIDPRLFKAVVYTGDTRFSSNPGMPEWNNHCYGLIYDAPADMSYNTESPGYTTTSGNGTNNVFYTKLGITSATDNTNINTASQLQDIQTRINSLTQDINELSHSGINSDLNKLIQSSTDASTIISRINYYMNSSIEDISANEFKSNKLKDMNQVYLEVNNQKTLNSRKYVFFFYIILAICIIIGYASYTSELSILEQIEALKSYMSWGWWTNWGIITIVVILLIVVSFGWDARNNIMMVIRYLTDPAFWTGQMWWVGVTLLLLLVIFMHASFKSFFGQVSSSIQEGITK